jgi:hypothetical protein
MGQSLISNPLWRTPYASLHPRATAPSHLAALPGRPGWPHHRRGPWPGAAHRPESARPPPSWWSGCPVPVVRLVWSVDTQARRIPGASRRGPAPGTSDLGSRIDPRDVAPPTPQPAVARRSHPATMVPARRSVPRAGGATTRRRLATGPATSRGLANGRGRAGEAADRSARLVAADRRRMQRRGAPDRGFPPWAIGLRSRTRRLRRNCDWPSATGAGPSGFGWTTGRLGARGATCRRTWSCGCSEWG